MTFQMEVETLDSFEVWCDAEMGETEVDLDQTASTSSHRARYLEGIGRLPLGDVSSQFQDYYQKVLEAEGIKKTPDKASGQRRPSGLNRQAAGDECSSPTRSSPLPGPTRCSPLPCRLRAGQQDAAAVPVPSSLARVLSLPLVPPGSPSQRPGLPPRPPRSLHTLLRPSQHMAVDAEGFAIDAAPALSSLQRYASPAAGAEVSGNGGMGLDVAPARSPLMRGGHPDGHQRRRPPAALHWGDAAGAAGSCSDEDAAVSLLTSETMDMVLDAPERVVKRGMISGESGEGSNGKWPLPR